MNRRFLGFLVGLFVGVLGVSAADSAPTKELPPLPEVVTLASGAVLRKPSIVRWEKDRVVIRHAGGVDPIRFSIMAADCRAVFEAHKAVALESQKAEQTRKAEAAAKEQADYNAKIAWEARVAKSIQSNSIIVGMTAEDVRKSWGAPQRINSSGGNYGVHEQWVYPQTRTSSTYLYFEEGKLTSWQD